MVLAHGQGHLALRMGPPVPSAQRSGNFLLGFSSRPRNTSLVIVTSQAKCLEVEGRGHSFNRGPLREREKTLLLSIQDDARFTASSSRQSLMSVAASILTPSLRNRLCGVGVNFLRGGF